ncbi:hypothetical protein CN156_31225, partial [Sinorhizobium meliloti]
RNQSHPQSPRSSKPGESDILTLQKQDTLTLRLQSAFFYPGLCHQLTDAQAGACTAMDDTRKRLAGRTRKPLQGLGRSTGAIRRLRQPS